MCGLAEATELAEAAIEHERRGGDPRRIGVATALRACGLVLRLQPEEALPWLAESREQFTRAGDELGVAITARWAGHAALHLGDLDTAAAELAAADASYRKRGDFVGIVGTLVLRAELAQQQGDDDDAAAAFEELSVYGTGAPATQARASLANLRRKVGRLEEARALADQAVAESRDGFSPFITALALHARGFAHLDGGDLVGALDDLARAPLFFGDSGRHALAADSWLGASAAAEALGDRTAARAHAEAAVAAAARTRDEDLQARAQARRAQLAAPGDGSSS
jgi:tetratricopeptide (TPR) repeat protein